MKVSGVRWSLALLGWFALGVATISAAQSAPPINGVTGTVALEGTVEQEQAAANAVIVKTKDKVGHVFHVTKDLLLHGGKGTSVDAFAGLREGTTVVVHDTAAGAVQSARALDRTSDEGQPVTEGVVIDVNRARKQITIRFANGKTEAFRLADRAAASGNGLDRVGADAKQVIVSYTDDTGRTINQLFKKTS